MKTLFLKEEGYFSVSDVVEILTESVDVKQYIKKDASSGSRTKYQVGYNLYPC